MAEKRSIAILRWNEFDDDIELEDIAAQRVGNEATSPAKPGQPNT
jgi:hypothetical protein